MRTLQLGRTHCEYYSSSARSEHTASCAALYTQCARFDTGTRNVTFARLSDFFWDLCRD